jgi:cellulose synthase/poly-beta-1,6-N-acetylglucosamine synthase-like glycosyltransferase
LSPKISIITVCYNSAKTIEDTIQSVLSQNYKNIEYIIIDGLSTDNTLEIINQYKNEIAVIVSEKDREKFDDIYTQSQTYMTDIIKNAVAVGVWDYHKAANLVYDEIYADPSKVWGDEEIQESLSRHQVGYKNKMEVTKQRETQAPIDEDAQAFLTDFSGDDTNG